MSLSRPLRWRVRRETARCCDEELTKLPARYRAALVLCCLEGLPKSAAARRLGWPEGTVAAYVSRGRKLLLLGWPDGDRTPMGVALLAAPAAQALPPSLSRISPAAYGVLHGGDLTTLVSPGALRLLNEGTQIMWWKHVALFTVVSLVLSMGVLYSVASPGAGSPLRPNGESIGGVQGNQPAAANRETPQSDRDRLQGRWRLVAEVPDFQEPWTVGSYLEFTGDRVRRLDAEGKPIGQGMEEYAGFRVNQGAAPMELDMLYGENVRPGVYALQADTLIYSTSQQGNIRPTELRASGRFGAAARVLTGDRTRSGDSREQTHHGGNPLGPRDAEPPGRRHRHA